MPTRVSATTPVQILTILLLTGSALQLLPDTVSGTCSDSNAWTILEEFYNSTNGAHWTSPWNMSDTRNSLDGVTFDGNCVVTSIDLAGRNLSGTLPKSLGNFTSLTTFVVSHNLIRGTLPPQYSAWKSISQFLVANNSLSGTLPHEYMSWIKLGEFHIHQNEINGTLPSSLSNWTSIRFFSAFENKFTGTLPPEYSAWGRTRLNGLKEFSLHKNSLSGSLPPEYGSWADVNVLSLANNLLSGTIPNSWITMNLTSFLISYNNLTGSIPPELLLRPYLNVFAVSHNNLNGSIGDSTAQYLFAQNNSRLDGKSLKVSNCSSIFNPCAVAICSTQIQCPSISNLLFLCLGDGVEVPFDISKALGALRYFAGSCTQPPAPTVAPPLLLVPSPTITTPLPPYIVTPNVPPAYVPSFTPPAAFVAAISIIEPTGGVGLIALGASRCAPAAMKSSTSPGRVLLSPFYALGNSISVLGNLGLTVTIVMLHYTSVRVLMWKQLRNGQHEVSHKRGKNLSSSSNIANDIMSTVRFPHISFLCVVHLAKGVAFHGGQSLLSSITPNTTNDDFDESTTDTEDALALSAIAASTAALALIGLVISVVVVQVERRGVARKQLHFQTFRQAALHRIRWLPPWTLPTGMWFPEAARRRIGVLRGPIRNGCEHFAMLWSVVSVLSSLATGAVPGSAGGCIGLAVVQVVILGGACLVVVVYRPMRTPLGGWLVCATWVVEVCISLSLAVARSMNHTEAPVEATVVLSTLHTIIGVLRFAHRGALRWWERGLKPNDMTPAANCSPLTCNLTNSVNSDNRRLPKNENKRNKNNRGSRINLCQLMALSEDDHAKQTTHILSLGDSNLCGQHGDRNEVAVRLSTLITMCCERRAVGSVRY
ncbi:GP46-like surface antigen, putative [Bodo saltans]|uniref:GP46-like surface antigen, putative n=1 Tax=Bodo saltans TaxID=75058 RepID=A0A0S4JE04_BODSA|nr:GP46-like surface antigen, putative [Bodo saltans]|eukprot:CUG89707.1 GP46-like surface antigen, putative [Bodo saltans]